MYPIFITDDPNASVSIPSLPGQSRWGVDRLEELLAPLVKKGLKSVILFGVPLKAEKVGTSYCERERPDDHARTAVVQLQTTQKDLSLPVLKRFAPSSRISTLPQTCACANTPTMGTVESCVLKSTLILGQLTPLHPSSG